MIWIAIVVGLLFVSVEAKHMAQLYDLIALDLHKLALVFERHAAGWRGYKRAVDEEARIQNPQSLRRIK